jgi:hypothetical protein
MAKVKHLLGGLAPAKSLFAASAVVVLASAPSLILAAKSDIPSGQAKKISRAVPSPVAGVGLPSAAAVGVYVWYRRRKARKDVQS